MFREELAGMLVNWLNQLPSLISAPYQAKIREIIAIELFREIPGTNGCQPIDLFLDYDFKLWKQVRVNLRELYINILLVGGEEFKKKLANRFALRYLHLAESYIFCPRERDLSVLHFAVQLFTPPSIADHLVDNTSLVSQIFSIMIAIYESSDSANNELQSNFFNVVSRGKIPSVFHKLTCSEKLRDLSMISYRFMGDVSLLCNAYKKRNVDTGNYFLQSEGCLKLLLDLCTVWQGMYPQTRQRHTHVMFEDERWLHAVNVSFQVLRLLDVMCNSFYPSASINHTSNLVSAISKVEDSLLAWTSDDHVHQYGSYRNGFHILEIVPGQCFTILDFQIGSREVSFYNPLHWFYSALLAITPQILNIDADLNVRDFIRGALFKVDLVELHDGLSIKDQHMLIFDYYIRSQVLLAQIKAGIFQINIGLWVRNGEVSMRTQEYHYRKNVLQSCNYSDFFMLQIASIRLGSELFFTMLIDRFDISPFFKDGPINYSGTIYDDSKKMISIVQDFIRLIITILSERTVLSGKTNSERLRREIIHHLAVPKSGIQYSELVKKLQLSFLKFDGELDSSISKILDSVSSFKFPEGPTGQGVYQLQDTYYSEVDPWFLQYSRNQREEVEQIIETFKKKDSNMSSCRLFHLQPSTGFDRLNDIIHSLSYHRVLFYSLSRMTHHTTNTIGPKDEMILSGVIHLLCLSFEIFKSQPLHPAHSSFALTQMMFISNSVNIPLSVYPNDEAVTLLELILDLVDRANEVDIKEHAHHLRYLVGQFEKYGDEKARKVISGWYICLII
jgi:E3 ubiquitin-protein ligase UBR1